MGVVIERNAYESISSTLSGMTKLVKSAYPNASFPIVFTVSGMVRDSRSEPWHAANGGQRGEASASELTGSEDCTRAHSLEWVKGGAETR